MTTTNPPSQDVVRDDPIIPSESPTKSSSKTIKISPKVIPHSCEYKNHKFYKDQISSQRTAMAKLMTISMFAILFMLTELIGGAISNSLAILTDAAHQLSDVAGFLLSFFAIYM
jgi:zinc transporter 2